MEKVEIITVIFSVLALLFILRASRISSPDSVTRRAKSSRPPLRLRDEQTTAGTKQHNTEKVDDLMAMAAGGTGNASVKVKEGDFASISGNSSQSLSVY